MASEKRRPKKPAPALSPKSCPELKTTDTDSTSALTGGAGDPGLPAPRSSSAPEKMGAPGSSRATAKGPRVRATDSNDTEKNIPSVKGSPVPDKSSGKPQRKYSPYKNLPVTEKAGSCPPRSEAFPPGVRLDARTVEAVERETRGQRENPAWFAWRRNRITASNAHRFSRSLFATGRSTTPPASYLKAMTGVGPGVQTRAMSWGIQKEAEAVRWYQSHKSQTLGRPVRVQDCGLFIDPERSWLAASPDGIVEDLRTGERLLCLEVKCPYKHREKTVEQACREDRAFCLELQQGQLRLKPGHSYYTQVQCQMAVTGMRRADFVVFTLQNKAVVSVTFDPMFWEDTLGKLELFYMKGVLPELRKKGQVIPAVGVEE